MLDEPDPPPSRLLLLAPEIRTLVLEELIARGRCARGYTRVDLAPLNSKVWCRQGSLPVSYLRTCRKLSEEASHFFYSTSVFHFEKAHTLSHFLDCRPSAQLWSIQHLQFTVPDWIFSFDSWDEVDRGTHLMAFEVSEALHTTRKLQNLQNLDLLVSIPDRPDYWRENRYFTQIIRPLLEYVNDWAIVTVDAKAPSIEGIDQNVVKQKHWGPRWSEEISFCWASLNLESQRSSIASPTYKAAQGVHTDFVLKKCHIV